MKYINFKSSLGTFKVNLSEAILSKEILSEELSKTDLASIEKLIDSKFKKIEIESKVKEIVQKELGGDKNEKKITEVVKNCLIQLYKQLWMKRSFWESGISNKSN